MKYRMKKIIRKNFQQVIFVFIAFSAMVLVSYFYVSDIVQKQMLVLGDETMNTIEASVSASLTEAELSFSNIVHSTESLLSAGESNKDILNYLVKTNDYFSPGQSNLAGFMKVYGYIRNEFLSGSGWVPPADYAPKERPWYIGATANSGNIFFSEPYIDAETGKMCISFSKELLDNTGKSYGVLAIDLKLNRITDYITEQKISNNGYGILASDQLHIVAHRDAKLLGYSMPDMGEDYGQLSELLKTSDSVSAKKITDIDGTSSIAFFRTIFLGWHIGVIIPSENYYAPVNNLAIVLGILGFILMSVLSYILIHTHSQKIRADEESRSKSSFLARMSHEMRTPMNAIMGMTGIAIKSDDIDKIQSCLEKINDSAGHLLGIINDVLDMSKIEAGKLELSPTDFSFQHMIDQVSAVAGYKIEEKRQNFMIQIDDDVPAAIFTDQQRLTQVITNLLSNASKFAPEGGSIQLIIKRLDDTNGQCALQFEVSDNGIGISKEQQNKLFHAFEQADVSISRKYGGTGLGLSISKKIIEMMDGQIWIESELGQGARFFFTIQADIGNEHIEKESDEAHDEETLDQLFGGKHILLAEDVDINRELLIALFENTGIHIDCAVNGIEAVEMFSAQSDYYDLIFMDIHMPELDGYEATKQIRSMEIPSAKSIPIIAMTANVFKEDIEKCLASGMNDHLGKPLNVKELMEKTKKYLKEGR